VSNPGVLVADRGLLSLDNLEALKAVRLASGKPLEFIVAVPGRRYNEFIDLLEPFHEQQCAAATQEVVSEHAWNDLRLVVAHDPVTAAAKTGQRNERIDALIRQADEWSGKLTEQDEGVKHRGRKLSDSGAKARFYHAVSEAHLSRILKVDLGEELFSYHIDEKAKRLAEMMDGKLLLVTNAEGLTAQNVIQRYKSLADIERGFKVLKSEIEIGPVYHRLPERIRAHASICFMALILHRVMRSRLKAADAGYTPERALEQLQRIQHHRVRLNGGEPVAGVSTLSTEQNEVLHALGPDPKETFVASLTLRQVSKLSGRSYANSGLQRLAGERPPAWRPSLTRHRITPRYAPPFPARHRPRSRGISRYSRSSCDQVATGPHADSPCDGRSTKPSSSASSGSRRRSGPGRLT
jgi:hypothetical protein